MKQSKVNTVIYFSFVVYVLTLVTKQHLVNATNKKLFPKRAH